MISSCNIGPFEMQTSSVALADGKLQEDDECYEFQIEQNLSRRVHLFYLDYFYEVVRFSLPLAKQVYLF